MWRITLGSWSQHLDHVINLKLPLLYFVLKYEYIDLVAHKILESVIIKDNRVHIHLSSSSTASRNEADGAVLMKPIAFIIKT